MSGSHKFPQPKRIGTRQSDTSYVERLAVRLLISNDQNQIALIYVTKGNYYKLPGGGIETDEDHTLAAQREALEETGCKVSIGGGCFATAEEFRNDLHQVSYCYCARMVEDTGVPELTDEELAEGLRHEWISAPEAMKKMKECEPTTELGRYIKERDIYFVGLYLEL